MSPRLGLGPVFAADCLATSRRWQVYAGRSMLIACVLVAVLVAWLTQYRGVQGLSYQHLAAAGSTLVRAIMGLELTLALAIVPAVTAGAICQDKLRGGLTLMMVTDLSDTEIVLGRLASRLVTVLGVIACGLPVLAMLTSLGGVNPIDILTGTAVICGVSVLGVCVAFTFSVWATRPHEALTATYAVFAVWLLALLAWTEVLPSFLPGASRLFHATNPVWLLLAGDFNPEVSSPFLRLSFLAGSLILSAALALLSIWRIRKVTLRQASGSARPRMSRAGARGRWFQRFGLPAVSMENSPVLWREVYQRLPSRWGLAIWRLYGTLSVIFTFLAISNTNIAPGTGALIVSTGLLLVAVGAATVLAEERSHGSLDVLLSTPLSTQSIVLGKWWGAFRPVPRIAVLPGLIAFAAALANSRFLAAPFYGVLTTALVLSYGAFFTSLGLAFAAWQARLGRAVGFSVAAYLILTIIYPAFMISMARAGPNDVLFLWVSPFFGMYLPLGWICRSGWHWFEAGAVAMLFWVALTASAALLIRRLTVRSFDRLLGRMPETRGRPVRPPKHKYLPRQPVGSLHD
jgi:hypothetical protein